MPPILLAIAVGTLALATPLAAAQTSATSDEARLEARERFAQALELYEEGLLEQSLEEFRRAYALAPTPQVLYNLGLVYAGLGRAVEAVDALERYRTEAGAGMTDARREEVEAELRRQRARIAFVTVQTSTPGATVFIDGIDRGPPRAEAYQVTSGTVLVEVRAEGYESRSVTLRLAGGVQETVNATLTAARASVGRVRVDSDCEGCPVFLDGVEVGVTPLADTMAVAPGQHVVEVRRPGYLPARAEIETDAGEQHELSAPFPLATVDPSTSALIRVELPVAPTEVIVDGESIGTSTGVRVAPGAHRVVVRAPQRLESTTSVTLAAGETRSVTPRLQWENEAEQLERVRHRTRTAWINVGVGLAFLAAAVPIIAVMMHGSIEGQAYRDTHPELFRRIDGENGCMTSSGFCGDSPSPSVPPITWAESNGGWWVVAGSLFGLATVFATIGTGMLLSNDNESAVLDRANLRVSLGPGSVTLGGEF